MRKYIFNAFLFILIIFTFYHYASAQTAEELRTQIKNTNSEIEKINQEIKALSNQIAVTSEQKNTLANAIKDLTLKKNKLIKERQQTEAKIKATGLVIKSLDNEIVDKISVLDKSRESLANLLKSLNQQDDQSILEKLLTEKSLSDFSREYNNIIELNSQIKNHINNVTVIKNNLTVSKEKKVDEQDALTILKNSLTAKELEIAQNKKEKDTLLKETQNKEANYKKLLAENEKRKDAFEKEIENYESQLQFILNPKSIPKEGSGILSWPLNSIIVTSFYGNRCLLSLYGSCKFHYGLDFRAVVGTPVLAMAGGVVEGIGNTDSACQGASFGKWVFIRYNNGLSSTYGHLSSITANVGQKVSAGDTVGLSGGKKGVFGSGSSTGPHLHVSVYVSEGVEVKNFESKSCFDKVTKKPKIFTQPMIKASNAYLDPSKYLPPITSSMVKK